jgi:hypothetical protein
VAIDTNVDLGKVVLFEPNDDQAGAAQRRAEKQGLQVETTADPRELPKLLVGPSRGVLVLCNFSPGARAVVRSVRDQKGWKRLAVFAIVPDVMIDTKMLRKANELQVELLPTSVPEGRRWQKLKEAHDVCRAGGKWMVCNRRAHFRLPLSVKAVLMSEAETIDISEGGVAFLTNQVYHTGDTGKIDVRSLLGDMDEDQRGFAFEVVAVKSMKQGPYRFSVGAKFIELSDFAKDRLKMALELIEPTSDE